MHSYFRRYLFYSFFSLLVLAALPWLLFVTHSPVDIQALGQIEFFEAGKKITFPVNKLSESMFWLIRITYPVLVAVFAALTIAFFKADLQQLPQKLWKFVSQIRQFLKQEIQALTWLEKIVAGLTFFSILAERCYYLFQYPIHTDEAASYLLFIQHGPFAITSFYPIPNNHLLQNLLAWPLTFVFQDPFWALRLPSVAFSLCLSFFGFLLLKRWSDFLAAYLTVSLFSLGSLTMFLSTQGRGYMLLTLLTVVALALLFRALKNGAAGYWVAFSFISALGFYAVLTFAYPFAAFLVFDSIFLLVKRKWLQFFVAAATAGLTLLGTSILYLPLLLISGREAMFNNRYLVPLTPEVFTAAFPTFLIEVQGELVGGKFGYGIRVFLILMALLALLFIFQQHQIVKRLWPAKTNWLAGFTLLTTLVVFGLMRLQLFLPPPRVLFFKSFFDYVGLAIVLSTLLTLIIKNLNLRIGVAFLGTLIFAGFQITKTEAFLKDYPQPYYTSPALNKLMLEKNAHRVYVEEAFYQLFLEYEFARHRKTIQIENQVTAPGEAFDFVVLEHQKAFPAGISDSLYREVYKDDLVRAFVPKK